VLKEHYQLLEFQALQLVWPLKKKYIHKENSVSSFY
jgi:hypothetical protein